MTDEEKTERELLIEIKNLLFRIGDKISEINSCSKTDCCEGPWTGFCCDCRKDRRNGGKCDGSDLSDPIDNEACFEPKRW